MKGAIRTVIFLVVMLFFAASIYAACDVTDTLNKTAAKTYTVNGNDYEIKFYSLKNVSGDLVVKLKVNGEYTGDMEENMKYTFDDLSEIRVLDILPGSVSLNDLTQICFNSGLSCADCGTCSSIKDCEDNNPCTIDECDGDPLECKHKLILWCRDDDGCCPESRCTEENDNDCGQAQETTEVNASGLNGSNMTGNETLNHTSLNTTELENGTITIECISGDGYCPENCTFETDLDCDECSVDADCDDGNACTDDSCLGIPKRCSNETASGCSFDRTCLQIGARTEEQFCNKNNKMLDLRGKKEYCHDDYVCLSGKCAENKCKGIGFFKTIGKWIKFW
ncbi:hypothetical protein KY366_01345 [Candidatus Woesearchaeota archaeon]|nr:hypothetical protein [Candidatus Woesearchaeota archaeon]